MFFVSVQADFDEPVVLREVRRLADRLRAMPGVANAWSVADLFTGVAFAGRGTEPHSRRRRRSEADLGAGAQRSGRGPGALGRPPRGAGGGALRRRSHGRPPGSRSGKSRNTSPWSCGALSSTSTSTRLGWPRRRGRSVRGCWRSIPANGCCESAIARAGRSDLRERQAVERAARQAATIPAADPGRLAAEVGDVVRAFIVKHPFPLPGSELRRLQSTIVALGDPGHARRSAGWPSPRRTGLGCRTRFCVLPPPPWRARWPACVGVWWRAPPSARCSRAPTCRRRASWRTRCAAPPPRRWGRWSGSRRRSTIRVRSSWTPCRLAASPTNRALSVVWNRALPIGMGWAAVLLALLLAWVGGPSGLSSLPIAFAPLAAAAVPAALLGEPVALPTMAFFAGALAGGTPWRLQRPRRARFYAPSPRR